MRLNMAVGFGVKSREDMQQLGKIAEIVIAGSVFVSLIKSEGVSTVMASVRTLL